MTLAITSSHRSFPRKPFSWMPCGAAQSHDEEAAMVAIHAVHYNFARVHKTLRIAPAMAVGLSDHVWSLEEMVLMADSYLPKPGKRGSYKKKHS
jgi:hypothetical protein